jgi:hypothetical protein
MGEGMMTPRWYVGIEKAGLYRAFRARLRPSPKKYGRKFGYIIGPFRTKRGALWAERFGMGNPNFTHVDAAERIAKFRQEVNA